MGKIEGRRRGWQRMSLLDGITNSMDMSFCKLQEIVKDRKAWFVAVHGVEKSGPDWVTQQQWCYFPQIPLPFTFTDSTLEGGV